MSHKTCPFKLSVIGFIAGFLATLFFHQGTLYLLFHLGIIPKAPYSMHPTNPFGVPAFLSLAFFGGIWGIIGVVLFKKFLRQKRFYVFMTLFGGIFPPLIAVVVVFPLKHIDPHLLLKPASIAMMFTINALWGFGSALFTRIFINRQT